MLVVGGALVVGVVGTQEDLADRATVALDEADLEVDSIRMDGRDAVVAAPIALHEDANAILADIAGIRTVRFEAGDAPAVAAPGGEPTPSTSTAPPGSTPTTVTPTEQADGIAYLRATLEGGRVVIEGALPDAAVAAELGALAELIYAPLLQNDVVIDETVDTAPWVKMAPLIVARLPIIGTSSVRVSGNEAIVTGLAPTEERMAQFVGAMQQVLGPDVSVSNEVLVTGFAPPLVRAEAPGDGTVRLTGTMPNEAVAQMIAGTAVQVFGADVVINELEVGRNIDTTFSLFRLPLAFVAFEPVPQWEVTIDDDVITGELRGGATFPIGSSELTPELLALMPVAAGILARNPTLGMIIEGHTDSVGGDAYNLRLSVARAESARNWLIEAGIDGARVLAVGYGETQPIGDNGTAEGRALNRRVEFVLAPASALGDQS
jgi:flagellar motor protein MotB